MKKNLFTLCIFLVTPVWAAGYLEFDANGTPYKWDSGAAIQYSVDTSDLGPIDKGGADGADDIVANAFTTWSTLPGATLTFNLAGDTATDVTAANITSYVDFNGTTCETPDFVVVYDDNGTIFSALFGGAASGILGLASPSVLSDATHEIGCAYALLNGDEATDVDAMKYTVLHEFGHAQNLEHSEINGDLAENAITGDDDFIPLMYPIIPSDPGIGLTGGFNGLKLDDQFSLLYLYNQSLIASEARIRGKILKKDGTGVLGANVICYDKANPDENAVSWVSDAELDGQGEYVCGHLPPGDYQVKIEPITVAINSWDEGTPPYVASEFYNGSNESFSSLTDDRTEKTDITLPAATTVDDVNIVLNDDGKITSEQTITGTLAGSSYADLEYFIYVPQSVSKATFDLQGTPSTSDIDIYGKCNDPFSLAVLTAGSFYNPTADSQQAEFAGAGTDGTENVVLDSDSVPEIDNCEYHLLLVNYDSDDVTYELTVTLEGNQPELKADFQPTNRVQDNDETLVSDVVFQAIDDQFTITSMTFTDQGILPLSDVGQASFYQDENDNGQVDDEDILLATTTSIDDTTRQFTFSDVSIFIEEGGEKNFLITYDIPTGARSFPLAIFFVGLLITALFARNKKTSIGLMILFSVMILNRCSSSSDSDFNPRIVGTENITAEASGFGQKFSLEVGVPTSVKDFFE